MRLLNRSLKYLKQFSENGLPVKGIFIFYILLHLFLINVNVAEWGDSYRILRASEYIRNFEYPVDEKRPPLFSFLLALRPENVDQIMWGKWVMFAVSIAAFWIFKKFVGLYLKDTKYKSLALILFTLNPVFLYWSLRIYADVPFTVIVLASLYLFKVWEDSHSFGRLFLVGLLAGLAVITRFEGYLLLGSVGLSLLIKKQIKDAFYYSLGAAVFVLPYLIWRNPLTSTYLEEPAGRSYDLQMLATYLLSLLFAFGFTSAVYFLANYTKKFDILKVYDQSRGDIAVAVFVLIELFLVLLWPAAVPRLFVPVIPFLIILLVRGINTYFEGVKKTWTTPLLGLTTLVGVYAVGQYWLKLQFLILNKSVFFIVLFLQLLIIYSIIKRKFNLLLALIVVSSLTWSLSTIYLHKDNLKTIKVAAQYASENLTGIIGYNDVSSVSDWYLNQRDHKLPVSGKYYPYAKKIDLSYESVNSSGVDYLILTNEHNTDMTLDFSNRPYLDVIKDFEYTVGGKTFFAKIVEFLPENR